MFVVAGTENIIEEFKRIESDMVIGVGEEISSHKDVFPKPHITDFTVMQQ